jgi:hypothetical protein
MIMVIKKILYFVSIATDLRKDYLFNFPTKKPPESMGGHTVICQKYEIFNAQI